MNVLVLPGGGVRGVLQARLLERLEAQRPFLAKIDAYAGCSIGVVNAMWLALGRDVRELVPLYRRAAPFVFGSGFMARHASAALRATLQTYLGDGRMGDLKKPVLAYAVSMKGLELAREDELLVDVALASTAAPPVLLPHEGKVDGGLAQSDPSAMALDWLAAKGHALADLRLLSVGTGYAVAPSGGGLFAGLRAFAAASACSAQVAAAARLGERYCRLQPQLDRPVALDDADAIEELLEQADRASLEAATYWLRRWF